MRSQQKSLSEVKDFQDETGGDLKELGHAARMPGFTSGAPGWVEKEREGMLGARYPVENGHRNSGFTH